MRIRKFSVKGLHGLIDAQLDFHSDLTVIVGRNGSGKTSVLDLISNLLRLDLEVLRRTTFTEAILELEDAEYPNAQISVHTNRGTRSVTLMLQDAQQATVPLDIVEPVEHIVPWFSTSSTAITTYSGIFTPAG